MTVVKIDGSNDSNFQQRRLIDRGTYIFEIANEPVVEKAKTSDNMKVSVELRCQDEGEFKGQAVYDTIILTPKAEWKLCHLVLACGTQTREEMKENGVDLSLLKGSTCEAEITIEAGGMNPQTGQRYPDRNRVSRYIFSEDNS